MRKAIIDKLKEISELRKFTNPFWHLQGQPSLMLLLN